MVTLSVPFFLLSFLSAWIFILEVLATNSSPGNRCPVNMNRELGITDDYIWVCKCPPLLTIESVEPAVNGLKRIPVPFNERDDTQGRNEAFLRCVEDSSGPLNRLCVSNTTLFEIEAERIMRHCFDVSLTAEEESKSGPLTFTTETCSTRLVPVVTQSETTGVWLCECEQPGATELFSFDVVVGQANLTTNASPTNAIQELDEIERCTAQASKQLEDVCFNAPGDFDLVALHVLEACCKRARALSDTKFLCEALIPENVDALKIQREPLI